MVEIAKAGVKLSIKVFCIFIAIFGLLSSIFIYYLIPILGILMLVVPILAILFPFTTKLTMSYEVLKLRGLYLDWTNVKLDNVVSIGNYHYKNCITSEKPLQMFDFEIITKDGKTIVFRTSYLEGDKVLSIIELVSDLVLDRDFSLEEEIQPQK